MTALKISNQAYNRELKKMFLILSNNFPELNFKNDYGTYCSRDTFISKSVQGGAEWSSILKWVGQSSFSVMNRYVAIEGDRQIEAIQKIFATKQLDF
jgi:hypothetical protein